MSLLRSCLSILANDPSDLRFAALPKEETSANVEGDASAGEKRKAPDEVNAGEAKKTKA